MKSTGEVMGIAGNFPAAFTKTQLAIDYEPPRGGEVFISVNDGDKRNITAIARSVARLGFSLVATTGTARALRASGIECEEVGKIHAGSHTILDRIASGEIVLMINTPFGSSTNTDGYEMRAACVRHGVSYCTTLAGAQALIAGMEAVRETGLDVIALQDLPQWEG